jgi:release factor glutamine methyltransferase
LNYTYRPILQWYLKKDRRYRFDNISVIVKKGVFHPGFFFSTRFLLQALRGYDLKNKSLLEMGCGSGLISVFAAKNGADVTASDINPTAVSNAAENARLNGLKIHTVQSDLFSNIAARTFDYIIINPPYYRGHADNMAQRAWYAGPSFEYFEKLFQQIGNFMRPGTLSIMVLSADCEVGEIIKIANRYGLKFILKGTKFFWFERNFIYEISNTNI